MTLDADVHRDVERERSLGGVFLLGAIIGLACVGLLGGCGAREDLAFGDEASIETAAPTSASKPGSTIAPVTIAQVELVDTVPPTTAIATDVVSRSLLK